MIRKWSYVVNPFLPIALSSFKKAVKISSFTDAMLGTSTDAFYMAQYVIYHPLHLAMLVAYDTWKQQGGTQKGSSVLFYKLLNQLSSTKVDEWDAQVRVMYPKGSSEFVTIFPQGHKPFQQGSYDSRIRAVSALDGALTTIGTLPVTQADVHGFYNSINGARITQESEKGGTNGDSRSLVIAITKAMNGMFTFLNSALAHFSNDTESVEVMFDLQTIRQHEQTFFTGHVKPLQVRVVCKRTFHQSIMVEIENMSSLPLVVYSSLVKGAMPDGISVTVSAYQTMLVNLTDLGPLTNHYLQAYNANAFQEAEYHINLDPDAMEQAA